MSFSILKLWPSAQTTMIAAAVGLGLAAGGLAAPEPAWAVEPNEIMDDPEMEARAREISKDLRCVVCQNQSIDDSNSDLARDLRLLVRERLTKGDSNEQATQFIVDRYGDFVLLKPPFKPITFALWFGPAVMFLLGSWGIFAFYRKSQAQANAGEGSSVRAAVALSDDEKRRLAALLTETASGADAPGKNKDTSNS